MVATTALGRVTGGAGVQPEALRRGRGLRDLGARLGVHKRGAFFRVLAVLTRTSSRGGRRVSAGSDLAKTSVARCARRVETCGKPADAPTARSARRWRRASGTRARASVVSLENESRRIGGATRRGRKEGKKVRRGGRERRRRAKPGLGERARVRRSRGIRERPYRSRARSPRTTRRARAIDSDESRGPFRFGGWSD